MLPAGIWFSIFHCALFSNKAPAVRRGIFPETAASTEKLVFAPSLPLFIRTRKREIKQQSSSKALLMVALLPRKEERQALDTMLFLYPKVMIKPLENWVWTSKIAFLIVQEPCNNSQKNYKPTSKNNSFAVHIFTFILLV